MIKKLILVSALAFAVSIFHLNGSAYAHFPIEDNSTGLRAVFHVTPDHDPIAGKESIISYDFAKTGFQTENYSFTLNVKSTKSDAVSLPIDITGNVILASYTFPSQGFYDITLMAVNKQSGSSSKLEYGQRVSRGIDSEKTSAFGPLEIGIISVAVLIAIGAVIFSLVSDNNKRKVKKNDKKNHT